MVTPPDNFAMVWKGVYRSGYPTKKNFDFLSRLGLRSVLFLCPEAYPDSHLDFYAAHGIQLLQFGVIGNKEPFDEIPEAVVCAALLKILDDANLPLLIHCNQGKHRTGCLVGCLRKVHRWSLVSIFEEYRRFAGAKARVHDEQFIERFPIACLHAVTATPPADGGDEPSSPNGSGSVTPASRSVPHVRRTVSSLKVPMAKSLDDLDSITPRSPDKARGGGSSCDGSLPQSHSVNSGLETLGNEPAPAPTPALGDVRCESSMLKFGSPRSLRSASPQGSPLVPRRPAAGEPAVGEAAASSMAHLQLGPALVSSQLPPAAADCDFATVEAVLAAVRRQSCPVDANHDALAAVRVAVGAVGRVAGVRRGK